MENLKLYANYLSKFFEECELKSVTWDTEDDNLWLATFESKSGKKRQYKTNRQTMLAFCKKFYYNWEVLNEKNEKPLYALALLNRNEKGEDMLVFGRFLLIAERVVSFYLSYDADTVYTASVLARADRACLENTLAFLLADLCGALFILV